MIIYEITNELCQNFLARGLDAAHAGKCLVELGDVVLWTGIGVAVLTAIVWIVKDIRKGKG